MPIELLAPLAVIPVMLLFAFAGCSVPGFSLAVNIQWAGGLETDIASIEVAFSLDPDSGEDPSNLHPASTLLTGQSLSDFFANGLGDNNAALWADGSPGTFNCFCSITQSNTGKKASLLASISYDISDSVVDPSFQLARVGTGFEQSDFSLTSAS